MGQTNGLHAFGYNSAKSEPIWMKFGTLWAKCWGLASADFGHDPRSNDSLRGSLIFSGKWRTISAFSCRQKILQHFNTTTSIGVAM